MSKNFLKDQRGSALVLVTIVLVNALFIVLAISSISIIEKKNSEKVKNSSVAYQAADSGIEWALQKLNSAIPTDSIDDVFLGEDCSDSLSSSAECEVLFIDEDSKLIENYNTELSDVRYIRSIGRFGVDSYKVSRAVETYVFVTRDPVAFWKIDENDDDSSTIYDSSDNEFDADRNGDTDWADVSDCWNATDDSCLEFSSNDDYLNGIGDPDELNFKDDDNFSISVWLSVAGNENEWRPIITKGDKQWGLKLDEDGKVRFVCYDKDESSYRKATSDDNLVLDDWYHVVGVRDDADILLYIDKNLQSTQGTIGDINESTEDVEIARNSEKNKDVDVDEEDRYFDGMLDDLRVYDYALSGEEVSRLYEEGPE